MDEPGTLAALTPGDAGEVLTLQRAAFARLVVAPDRQGRGIGTRLLLATEDLLPPRVRTISLFTGQRSHANLQLYHRHGYRQTHTTQAGAHLLVHLAKVRPRRPGAFSSRRECS